MMGPDELDNICDACGGDGECLDDCPLNAEFDDEPLNMDDDEDYDGDLDD